MKLPDYSEYLKKEGMLNHIEQEWLKDPSFHDVYSGVINRYIKSGMTVLEIGCGTGNVAARLKPCNYTGVDANKDCIKLARPKNLGKSFVVADIREYIGNAELVFSFAVLKHFGLHEWESIFAHMASLGNQFIFDLPIGNEVKDDGEEHHHVWGTSQWVNDRCKEVGLKIIDSFFINPDEKCFITEHV